MPSNAALDFQVPYLKSVLGFLGMTDVEVIEVEGTAFGPDAAEKAVAAANAKLHAQCDRTDRGRCVIQDRAKEKSNATLLRRTDTR